MPTRLPEKVKAVVAQVPALTGASSYVHYVDRRGEGVWRATGSRGDFAIRFRQPGAGGSLEIEFARMGHAARAGIAPESIAFDEHDGWLVSTWVTGRPMSPVQSPSEQDLGRVANGCARLHALEPFGGRRADPAAALESYLSKLTNDQDALPNGFKVWRDRAVDLAHRLTDSTVLVPCHNDLFPGNLIFDDGPHCKLIDWEYAADNDAAYDLATFAVCATIGVRNARSLMSEYVDASVRLTPDVATAAAPTLPRVQGWMLVTAVSWLPWAITDDTMPPSSKAFWTEWSRLRYENITAEIDDQSLEQILAACG